MKRIMAFWALVTVSFLFFSCGETGLLFDNSGEEDFVIESIESGAVVRSGDTISVSLMYDDGVYSPDSLEILLVDGKGEVVGSTLLEGADLTDPLPPVSLPEMEPGVYSIRYLVRTENEIISEARFPFFHTDDEYLIQGITIYPPVILPGGSGLLEADIRVPEGSNPFFRWSSNDMLMFEGYRNEGADRIEWNAPASPGVYVITLELFPFGPEDSEVYPEHSTLTHLARVYVGEKQGVSKGDLLPEENYYALFHFRGSLLDSGTASDESLPVVINRPILDMREGIFGYYLDGTSGFETSRLLLPSTTTGAIPFSVTLRFLPEGEQQERDFFTVFDDRNTPVFRISTDTEGSPFLELTAIAGKAVAPSGIDGYDLDAVRELTVSVLPQEEGTQIIWFVDGLFSTSTKISSVFSLTGTLGYRSVIGGEKGFTGVIDEFGVYTGPESGERTADNGVFSRAMKEEYGKDLLLADGFDGYVDPEHYLIEGAYGFSEGALELYSGTSFTLPAVSVLGVDIRLRLEAAADAETGPFLFIHPDRAGTLGFSYAPPDGEAFLCPGDDEGFFTFHLTREGEDILVFIDGVDEPFRITGFPDTVDMFLDNRMGLTSLYIHSILMYKTGTKLAEDHGDTTVDASL